MITRMLAVMPPRPDGGKLVQIFEDEWFFAMRSAQREERRAKARKRKGRS